MEILTIKMHLQCIFVVNYVNTMWAISQNPSKCPYLFIAFWTILAQNGDFLPKIRSANFNAKNESRHFSVCVVSREPIFGIELHNGVNEKRYAGNFNILIFGLKNTSLVVKNAVFIVFKRRFCIFVLLASIFMWPAKIIKNMSVPGWSWYLCVQV